MTGNHPMLRDWSDFFGMTGSAAATLVGLLFVVVTLGNGLPTSRTMDIARASMTPALYSFSGVLLQSMIALVPWPSDVPSGAIFIAVGIYGFIYRVNAIRLRNSLHLKAINGPVDRIFHNLVPLAASVSLVMGGAGLVAGAAFAPFAVASASMLLLLSGIYRTWGQSLALIGMQEKL
jgi:hypothetical protein